MHPLGYFASAPDGTNDALILRDIEDQIGSYSESLTTEDKLAFLPVLSRYLYFKQWVVPDYSIGEALADTQMADDPTKRGKRGPAPSWNLGRTRSIRVPIAVADLLLSVARRLDNGELPGELLHLNGEDKQNLYKSA